MLVRPDKDVKKTWPPNWFYSPGVSTKKHEYWRDRLATCVVTRAAMILAAFGDTEDNIQWDDEAAHTHPTQFNPFKRILEAWEEVDEPQQCTCDSLAIVNWGCPSASGHQCAKREWKGYY